MPSSRPSMPPPVECDQPLQSQTETLFMTVSGDTTAVTDAFLTSSLVDASMAMDNSTGCTPAMLSAMVASRVAQRRRRLQGTTLIDVGLVALGFQSSRSPTSSPTKAPTLPPTNSPSHAPSDSPTNVPTDPPTDPPTLQPTNPPTRQPTEFPTNPPTDAPTDPPTDTPTDPPTESPTEAPTETPTDPPTPAPTNGTQPVINGRLQDTEVSVRGRISEFDRALLQGPNPCYMVHAEFGDDLDYRRLCHDYLSLEYIQPNCTGLPDVVPKIVHSVGKDQDLNYLQFATGGANPTFVLQHQGDDSALEYIQRHCGTDAARAYSCMLAPAYRADIFRFCALSSEGGIYLDEDIMPLVPLEELYSPCSAATVGHDIPSPNDGIPGKQMKILAAKPGARIFQCALDQIIENVKYRWYPETPLQLTGPLLLHQCYVQNSEDVAITYRDTRNARFPYTGLRRGDQILAYEAPLSAKHFRKPDSSDYGEIFYTRKVYRETCALETLFRFPSIDDRIKYYMATWIDGRSVDTKHACETVDPFQASSMHWAKTTPSIFTSTSLKQSYGVYVEDALKYLVSHWVHPEESVPTFMMQLGDTRANFDLPVMVKTRSVTVGAASQLDPIIVPLEMDRHFGPLAKVHDSDTAWELKKEILIWRGASTGTRHQVIEQLVSRPSKDIDVGFTALVQDYRPVNRTAVTRPAMNMKELLSYKYLLSLEGNDVASGLKWKLYSNSVVFMATPTCASWAMEDLLVPYYHYIPLKDDFSDLKEKIQWARENDDACAQIAQQATKYMQDLWASDKAQIDTNLIVGEIVSRYQFSYGETTLQQCLGNSGLPGAALGQLPP
ncbi:O-glucosyltransferase LpsA [Seminavis robusta]|uniref:O-glucosyltransferase LpsA n=1 Tax=Seminavis robusta TaxID=568900 RepID=A0A9N8DS20_9STRA|nr:O-glucosyltransferase LpsA [Seminavis robusta]|eukprot:Sro212_g088190.1 O-glucosyltransferase LpsA (835) ;mRNA; f:49460-52141